MTVRRIAAGIGLVGALAAVVVPAASAGNPHDQNGPSPSVTTLVSGPTPVKASAVPPAASSGIAEGARGATAASGGCGACLVTCWTATARSGPNDWSGSVFIYQHLYWCGNGAQVTYGSVSQSYSQSGWYRLDGAYGPWWSGGCIGCASLRASGYILWSWNTPLVSLPSSGTSSLNSTMYAYGGASV
jgi:hypothetical protein